MKTAEVPTGNTTTASSGSGTPPALALSGLSKMFQGQRALNDASLELREGEVHALLGQNGSGKSTLIKILAGYHRPDPGARAALRGHPFELGSAVAATAGGIRFIHQDLALVGELDAVDNLALSNRYARSWWLSDRRERRAAKANLANYGLDIDPTVPLFELSAAQRSMLATIRAVSGIEESERGLLVLDEPTASLPDREVRQLFELIRRLRDEGLTVLYVTHRLSEVFDLCDRVTILRNGQSVATKEVRSLNHDQLVELIIGRPVAAFYPDAPPPREGVLLKVTDMSGASVNRTSLSVHAGEIVGVSGLVGSGYETLLGMVFGAIPSESGEVVLDGHNVPRFAPRASIALGMGYASADRKRLDAVLDWTVRENLTLPKLQASTFGRWMSARAERKEAQTWLERLGVLPSAPERPFATLSGGNQQKVILARWLRCGSGLFVLEEPTAGVDVASKHAIYELITAAAARGAGVLLSSSDAEEVCAICDRVLIMRRGSVGTVLHGDALSVDAVRRESLRT